MSAAPDAWFFAAMEATWPPAATRPLGPFLLRDGAGGGKRVSAATVERAFEATDLDRAEAAMAEPLFLIRPQDTALDTALAARGYGIVDPVLAYAAPVDRLAGDLSAMAAFPHWPPLEVARQIWAEAGTGAARIAVMDRAMGAKAVILARGNDHPVGTAFAACAGAEAQIHAVEVLPNHRRQGAGANLLRAAANWARIQGATRLSLAVTERNLAARALYEGLGMEIVSSYHYRAR